MNVRSLLRYTLVILLLPAALLLMVRLVPVMSVASYGMALALFAILGLLNALVRPLIVRLTLPLSVYTVGLFSLVINAFLLWLATLILPGFRLNSPFGALVGAILLAALVSIADRWAAGPDYGVPWRTVRRFRRKYQDVPPNSTPGLLILEIDGLAEPILRRALDAGIMPTLAGWLRDGSHQLAAWEAGLPSQTSSSQAGILHGNNWDIPAYRWYEKERRHLMVSGHPPDAALLNSRISNGAGLLHRNGVSIGNSLNGDAPVSVVTMSMVQDAEGRLHVPGQDFAEFFADPYAYIDSLGRTAWEVCVELWEAWRQRRQDVRPRVNRGGIYPLLRAVSTGALVDLSVYTLTEHLFKGIDVAYLTFVAYDEVAHHSGPETRDALNVLHMLDHRIARLAQVAKYTPRPYRFVVLSDHGQSQGATFLQRQGQSLAELVQSRIQAGGRVAPLVAADEGLGHVNVLLTEAARSAALVGRVSRSGLKNHIHDGFVDLTPARQRQQRQQQLPPLEIEPAGANVVVCVSGNLSLIYFTDAPGRLTLEEIQQRFPGLIDALRANPWIGFLMLRSAADGPVVLGPTGAHYLQTGRIEGDDPLARFGPRAADHLRCLDRFPHTGDIAVNSFYDPASGEVAAFEELVGSHGGLGGLQNEPFLLYPAGCSLSANPIIGAENLFAVLAGWL